MGQEQIRYRAARGTRDILPAETARWRRIERSFRELFARYGYEEIRVPIFEETALFARGTTRITGAAELRVKESDRIRTMCLELAKLGARVRELPDGLEIEGGRPLRGAACASHGDHRVAMSLAVAGGAIRGETRIADTACVATSFPGFWELLRGLGARVAEG